MTKEQINKLDEISAEINIARSLLKKCENEFIYQNYLESIVITGSGAHKLNDIIKLLNFDESKGILKIIQQSIERNIAQSQKTIDFYTPEQIAIELNQLDNCHVGEIGDELK